MRWYQWTGLVIALGLAIYGGAHEFAALYPGTFESDEDQVRVVATIDRAECGADMPLRIDVDNRSSQTIKRMELRVHVFERGDSTDRAYWPWPDWTHVVDPGHRGHTCSSLGESRDGRPPVRNPVVSVDRLSVQFFRDGEIIPR